MTDTVQDAAASAAATLTTAVAAADNAATAAQTDAAEAVTVFDRIKNEIAMIEELPLEAWVKIKAVFAKHQNS